MRKWKTGRRRPRPRTWQETSEQLAADHFDWLFAVAYKSCPHLDDHERSEIVAQMWFKVCKDLARREADGKPVEFPEDYPQRLYTEKAWLRQFFGNTFKNASRKTGRRQSQEVDGGADIIDLFPSTGIDHAQLVTDTHVVAIAYRTLSEWEQAILIQWLHYEAAKDPDDNTKAQEEICNNLGIKSRQNYSYERNKVLAKFRSALQDQRDAQ